jgi:hypothetical protein
MRSFQLDVGHRRRLTGAGMLVLLLSVATTAALGLAGGTWGTPRLGSGATALALILVPAGGGAVVWSVAAGFCGLAGLPLITPGGHGWDRRPVQFTLGWLQSVVFSVAVLCAATRMIESDTDQLFGKMMYLGGMLTVITCGTAGVVLQRGATSLRGGMVRGGLAGACLSAVCLGWMFVPLWLIEPGMGPVLGLASVTGLGGLLGVHVGLATVGWHRWRSDGRHRAFIHRPPGP